MKHSVERKFTNTCTLAKDAILQMGEVNIVVRF